MGRDGRLSCRYRGRCWADRITGKIMKYLFLLSILVLAGCQQMPAKASFVKKLTKNHQSVAEDHHALVMALQKSQVITGPQAMALLVSSSQTMAKAVDLGQEPVSIGLPPGMGQVGKGIIGMMMGNPMALTGLATGLMALVGAGGAALKQRNTIVAMNEEGRKLRDSTQWRTPFTVAPSNCTATTFRESTRPRQLYSAERTSNRNTWLSRCGTLLKGFAKPTRPWRRISGSWLPVAR